MSDYNVSVILPVYNASTTVASTIESVLNQSHKYFEFLILDDGSTDNSLDIISKYQSIDPRITVISRDNMGLSISLNELVLACQYNIIFRIDADDIANIDRLDNQINFLNENLDVVMVGGQIDFLYNDKSIKAQKMPLDNDSILQGLRQGRFPICHPAIAFRKNIALDVGLYSVTKVGEDLDFFLKMSEKGMLANIPVKVLNYRISLNSLSISKYNILAQSYAFAIFNHKKRISQKRELNWDEFEAIWLNRSFASKYFTFLYGVSERHYRKYLISKILREKKSIIYLIIAASLRPKTVLSKIKDILIK